MCKWDTIVHLTNDISGICCHAFLLCHLYEFNFECFKLFFVGVCVVNRCLFLMCFRMSPKGSVTMCLSN